MDVDGGNGLYSGTLKNYDVLLKSILVGDSSVGKSCLLARMVGDHVNSSHIATIGIDFKMHTVAVEGVRCRMQMWDTAGQERYLTLTDQYFRRVHGVFLVYDITNALSFQSVRRWMDHISVHAPRDVIVLLIGNKYDLARLRVVSRRDGEELAKQYGVQYMETSALEDINVREVVQQLCRSVLKQGGLGVGSTGLDEIDGSAGQGVRNGVVSLYNDDDDQVPEKPSKCGC